MYAKTLHCPIRHSDLKAQSSTTASIASVVKTHNTLQYSINTYLYLYMYIYIEEVSIAVINKRTIVCHINITSLKVDLCSFA